MFHACVERLGQDCLIWRNWTMARMQMRNPKASTSHHSQAFSSLTMSVLRFTMSVHLARDRPKPARAPYLAAIVWQKHISSMKPTCVMVSNTDKRGHYVATDPVEEECREESSEEDKVVSKQSKVLLTLPVASPGSNTLKTLLKQINFHIPPPGPPLTWRRPWSWAAWPAPPPPRPPRPPAASPSAAPTGGRVRMFFPIETSIKK